MRRWRRALAVIVLGPATTLVVAVGLSLFHGQPANLEKGCAKLSDGYHHVQRWTTFGAERTSVHMFAFEAADKGAQILNTPRSIMAPDKQGRDGYWITTFAYGWPFQFLYGCSNQATADNKNTLETFHFWILRDSSTGQSRYMLPDRPGVICIPTAVLSGRFLGSVGVWTAAWAVGLFVPLYMRLILRRRGRRCLACGYDRHGLAADAKCPECGTVQAPATK